MEHLIKILSNKHYPIVKNNRIETSGVYVLNERQETATPIKEGSPVEDMAMSLKEFEKLKIEMPIRRGILTVEHEDKVAFVELGDKELRRKVDETQPPAFTLLDRLVQYMLINKKTEIYFKEDVYSKDEETDFIKRDYNLESFKTDSSLLTILREASRKAKEPEPETVKESNHKTYEFGILVQGIEMKIVSWRNKFIRELYLKVLPPNYDTNPRIKSLFQMKQGIVLVNRDYVRTLQNLLNKAKLKRIAYKDLGSYVDTAGQLLSHFDRTTSIEEIRQMDFDINIINFESMENKEDIISLPPNKLNILAVPADTIKKAVNYLTMVGNNKMSTNFLLDNLIGIVANSEDYLIMDNWSRELIRKESNWNTIVDKLNTTFEIREGIDITKDIDISKEIATMLTTADNIGASNIDICPGSPIRLYQTKEQYEFYSSIRMTPELVEMMILNMISSEDASKMYENGELDFSYSIPGIGRYRVGVVSQRGSLAVSIRSVPTRIPSAEQLLLPEDFIEDAISKTKGFTLILGEPNSGKTVTFNCLIDYANRTRGGIIFLMGNPIEYTHRHQKSLVIQVEVGKDLPSYKDGIAKSKRMNTHILGFEELRTRSEFEALGEILTAPNSLFLTAHASSARKGLESLTDRIVETGVTPQKAHEDIANSLNYVIYQKLVDFDGRRVLVYEKIKGNPAIRNLIRKGNFGQLEHAIASDKDCESLDQVILRRLEGGLVDYKSVQPLITNHNLFIAKGYGVE